MNLEHERWYKNAVIYAIDVSTFYDSNGDGMGDLAGVEAKLDYLASLGVTCVWLLPFYPSSGRDNGYDVTDYMAVDPKHGTLDDFVRLVQRAGERGIRVLVDIVFNHTSDQHPWFQAARRDPASRFRGYYAWAEQPPALDENDKPMFPGAMNRVWTYDEIASSYYHHGFYDFQPSLLIGNPEVERELIRVIDFWLSLGVSGFRLDAANHMISEKGMDSTMPEHPHGILKRIRQFLTERNRGAILLGEADVAPRRIASFFGHGDQLTMLFNFLLDQNVFLALAEENATPIVTILRELPGIPDDAQWANFLRNLDELNLEKLHPEEMKRAMQVFAPAEDMRIFNRGIRRRLAPMLNGDRRRIELALSLLLSLPGTPALVYGDEIGMGDDLTQKGRNTVRTAMQWSGAKNGGFSTAKSLAVPIISKGNFGYAKVNAEKQLNENDSLLNWVRQAIYIRKRCEEIGWGEWHCVEANHPAVLGALCAWMGKEIVTLHNLSSKKVECDVDLRAWKITEIQAVLASDDLGELRSRDYMFSFPLKPYGYCWLRPREEAEN